MDYYYLVLIKKRVGIHEDERCHFEGRISTLNDRQT